MYDLVIKNGQIYDGGGNAPFISDIAIKDGIITGIGDYSCAEAEKLIDAEGRRVTPGFIDMHSHADLSIIQYPDAESLLGQGITTAFTGHCGMGMAPVGKYWKTQGDDLFAIEEFMPGKSVSTMPGVTPVCLTEQLKPAYKKYFGVEMDWVTFGDYMKRLRDQGVGINLAMEVGFQQIRQQIMGLDTERDASKEEIEEMRSLTEEAMRSGAFGLSIGYDYTPDMFASEDELDAVASVVKEHDGILTAHTRMSKDDDPKWQPIDGYKEFLGIAERTGVKAHISHIQPGFNIDPYDPEADDEGCVKTLGLIESYRREGVDVTWDVLHPDAHAFYYYPELCSPLIWYILACGSKAVFAERLRDETYRKEIAEKITRREHIIFPMLNLSGRIIRCSSEEYVGKSVNELAAAEGVSPEHMLLTILEKDIDTHVRQLLPGERKRQSPVFWHRPEATIGTDNSAFNYDYEGHRPGLPAFRSTIPAYCGFVKMLKHSEEAGIPFEMTVRKLCGNAAKILRLSNRGRIAEGQQADILVIDYDALDTNEDFIDPRRQPKGFDYVIVNGKIAVDHGVHTHVRSGMVLDNRKR